MYTKCALITLLLLFYALFQRVTCNKYMHLISTGPSNDSVHYKYFLLSLYFVILYKRHCLFNVLICLASRNYKT